MPDSALLKAGEETPPARQVLKRILNIALPMIASHASETVMLFVDRLFLSRVGKIHFSAAMTGGLTSFTVASFFAGTAGYVNAIVAQYYGASRQSNCANAAVQSIYLSLMAVPILILVALFIPRYFLLMGHDPSQVLLESTYAQWLISGSVFLLLRSGLTGFFLGIGKTRVVMFANLTAMVVNLPLNYVLIFGKLGLPALGIVGAAIGTIGGSITAFGILISAYLGREMNNRYGTRSVWKFDRKMFGRLVRFGSPAGVEIFLTIFAINLFIQLMHSYGADVAAANTITFNWDLVAFIPMLGLGAATTAIVGQYMGASEPLAARTATLLSLRLAFVYSGTMALLFLIGARPLVSLFSSGFGGSAAVSDLARQMLRLVGLYTIADSAQLVFTGALRGAGDTRWVMRTSVVLHWGLVTIAILLIRVFHASPLFVWVIFIGFIILLSITMFLRFRTGKWQHMLVI